MASEYIVTDRTLAVSQSIQVDDGQLFISQTGSAASSEPIIEDNTNPGTYWRVFVDDGMIGIEVTVTVQDDSIIIDDITSSTSWQLVIDDGILGITSTTAPVVIGRFKVYRSTFLSAIIRAERFKHTVRI